jgi:hypothetical protein
MCVFHSLFIVHGWINSVYYDAQKSMKLSASGIMTTYLFIYLFIVNLFQYLKELPLHKEMKCLIFVILPR